jgi:hypothetical protein
MDVPVVVALVLLLCLVIATLVSSSLVIREALPLSAETIPAAQATDEWECGVTSPPASLLTGCRRTLTWKGKTVTPSYPLQLFSGDVLTLDGKEVTVGRNVIINSDEEFDALVEERLKQ